MINEANDKTISVMTPEQFAHLGDGQIAYVKPLRGEDAARLFPQIEGVKPDMRLFALVGANGAPIMLTDSRDTAIATAWEHELQTVSLH